MDQHAVQDVDPEQAGEAQVFARGGQHQIGVDRRHRCGFPETQPASEGSTRGKSPERLRQVIASGLDEVVPRREPHRHAPRDRSGHLQPVANREGQDQRAASGQCGGGPAARDCVEREKEQAEHQGRPEVLLKKEKQSRQRHACDHRNGITQARDVESLQPPGEASARLLQLAEELPTPGEIRGQEEHQQELDRLHRLDRDGAHHQIHLGVAPSRPGAEDQQRQ